MRYLLGIDIGTSSVKSLLIGEEGTVAGIAKMEYDIKKPQQSWAEQSMEQIWEAAVSSICTLMSQNPHIKKDIAGISYSGQMHGLVMLDGAGREVRDTIIWADQRSAGSIERIYEAVPKETYHGITKNALSTGFLVSSLVWVRDHEPESYEKIRKVMLPKDYIRYRMCGQMGTDMSDASSTVVFDTAERQWAWDLIGRIGLEKSFFVPCYESWEIAGTVSAECAQKTGLPEGIPIAYGGGDTLVQALGNGMIAPGTVISNIGTASQLVTVAEQPVYDRKFRTNTFCHIDQRQWLLMGANLSGGVSLKWLKNQILYMESYDAMTDLAGQSAPGSNGLFFLPYLSGERTPWNDPDARGIYFGLSLKHNRADMIRAAMEGIIYAQRCSLEIFREMGLSFDRVIASGGGASSRVFLRIIADQFGCEVTTSQVQEQGCVGAAMIAGVGTGVFSDYKEACEKMVRFSNEITEPDGDNQKLYTEGFETFEALYPANRLLFRHS